MDLLEVGDRFPNVLVAAADGARALYNRHQGADVLVFWGLPYSLLCEATLSSEPVAISLEPEAGAPYWIQADESFCSVVAGGCAMGAVLLDSSLRLRARIDASDAQMLVDAVRTGLLPSPVPENGQGLVGMAPVLAIPRILEPALIDEVIAHFRLTGGQPSGVLRYEQGKPHFALDPSVKMRSETTIVDPQLEARVHHRVSTRVIPEIQRAFAFAVKNREHFKIIAYQAGAGYFRAHRDNDTPDVAHRRFAMTLNLNTGSYAGGCLRFPEFGSSLFEAEAGGALIFSCSLLHEVTDLQSGERLAMTTFLY